MATHKSITDPFLRRVMANELLVIRRQIKRMGFSRQTDQYFWLVMGIETALRRVEYAQKTGMQ